MKLRITILFLIMFTVFAVCDEFAQGASAKKTPSLTALIVTGQSSQYHDWTKSSPAFKKMLEQTGLFIVNIAQSPAKGQDMSSFSPNFDAYDVVVVDYEGDEWPSHTKTDFVDYVKNGGGVVIVHASNNAFPKWKEYNTIIGLGGWGGRNLSSGPMVRYKDGKTVYDFAPGSAGHYGPPTPYQVVNRDDSPVTAGLPKRWMHAKDELYCNLRGPAKKLAVLSTAYADPAHDGSGQNEPILFTINYGEGRVFHDVMGHVKDDFVSSIECVGFIITFQRGAEWAATGEVTQKIPADFPTADKVMSRKQIKLPTIERMLAEMANYKQGYSIETMKEIDQLIILNAQNTKMLTSLEQKFIEFLNSDATLDGKAFICKKLALLGTRNSINTLGKMLIKDDTSEIARLALEQVANPSVDELLRRSASKTSGDTQIGIVDTIGSRQDAKAVDMLGKFVSSKDPKLQAAALTALGEIANSKASTILEKNLNKLSSQMKPLAYDSYLKCADKMAATNSSKALEIYNNVYNSDASSAMRAAALKGMVRISGSDADAIIVEALKSDDSTISSTAASIVMQPQRTEQLVSIADEMSDYPPEVQIQIIKALTATGEKTVIKQIYPAVISDDTQVSVAAIEALGVLGDESTVVMLVDIIISTTTDRKHAARQSLYRLKGANVDMMIVDAIPNAKTEVMIELIKAVSNRGITGGTDILLLTVKDKDMKVQIESLKALAEIADYSIMGNIIDIIVTAKTTAVQKEAQKTLVALALKDPQSTKNEMYKIIRKSQNESVKEKANEVLKEIKQHLSAETEQ